MILLANRMALRVVIAVSLCSVLQACTPAPSTAQPELQQTGMLPAANPTAETASAMATATPHATAQPAPALLVLENQHLIEGESVQRFKRGDRVVLQFLSDQDAELHVHGYDLSLHLKAGETKLLSFDAEHAGRFEMELHSHHQGGHAALGALEIYP